MPVALIVNSSVNFPPLACRSTSFSVPKVGRHGKLPSLLMCIGRCRGHLLLVIGEWLLMPSSLQRILWHCLPTHRPLFCGRRSLWRCLVRPPLALALGAHPKTSLAAGGGRDVPVAPFAILLQLLRPIVGSGTGKRFLFSRQHGRCWDCGPDCCRPLPLRGHCCRCRMYN